MKESTSFRLSARALELLRELAGRLGLSQASTLEMLIRERARRENLQESHKKGKQ